MTTAELKDAREGFFQAFYRLLEASWADPGAIKDAEILEAADLLDDATQDLVDALRESRRTGTAADRRPRPVP